jgi:uncharacterized protein (TIGR03067 family)
MLNWFRALFGGKDKDVELPVTLETLQGKWRMVSVGKNGNFAPPQFFANTKIFLLIEGDKYSVETNGNLGDVGKLVIDTSKSPVFFDQVVTGGSDAGKTHLGIVRFRDGLLENCQAEKGNPRPKDFNRKRKDNASLASFRKQGQSKTKT